MIPQSPAIIYKSHQRYHTENEQHRLLATLNFEGYYSISRKPFGALAVLNDETLAAGHKLQRKAAEGITTLILPLVGGLEIEYLNQKQQAYPGEAVFIAAPQVVVTNPYPADLVNFLYIQLKVTGNLQMVTHFNLEDRNVLHPFITGTQKGSIGIFDGRKEAVYNVSEGHGLFAFVINGAFEVEGRLLEERDALSLWDTTEAEIEALSENAIILLMETPL